MKTAPLDRHWDLIPHMQLRPQKPELLPKEEDFFASVFSS